MALVLRSYHGHSVRAVVRRHAWVEEHQYHFHSLENKCRQSLRRAVEVPLLEDHALASPDLLDPLPPNLAIAHCSEEVSAVVLGSIEAPIHVAMQASDHWDDQAAAVVAQHLVYTCYFGGEVRDYRNCFEVAHEEADPSVSAVDGRSRGYHH